MKILNVRLYTFLAMAFMFTSCLQTEQMEIVRRHVDTVVSNALKDQVNDHPFFSKINEKVFITFLKNFRNSINLAVREKSNSLSWNNVLLSTKTINGEYRYDKNKQYFEGLFRLTFSFKSIEHKEIIVRSSPHAYDKLDRMTGAYIPNKVSAPTYDGDITNFEILVKVVCPGKIPDACYTTSLNIVKSALKKTK